jgi:hypothetical protein
MLKNHRQRTLMNKLYLLGLILFSQTPNIFSIECEIRLDEDDKKKFHKELEIFYEKIIKECNGDTLCLNEYLDKNIEKFKEKNKPNEEIIRKKLNKIAYDKQVKSCLKLTYYVEELKSKKKQINNKN